MFLAILLFVIGIVLIVKGGDFFVDAASWIAEVSGIPKFVVGATVVSLATTLPELLVSSMAASKGQVDMAIGNAIGSVTANTGLIMAIGVFFMVPAMKRKDLLPKGILLVVTIGALWILSMGGSLTVRESIVMMVIFVVFLVINIIEGKQGAARASEEEKPEKDGKTIGINATKFVLGAAAIVIGSDLLVDNGTLIATDFLHIDPKIIALTAVAIGTSLPELVTTVTAIVKKQSSLSVGNIIGANIIDCALILPVCAMISNGAIEVKPATVSMDMPVCGIVTLIMLVPSFFTQKFQKWQAILAFAVYAVYLYFVCMA